MFTPKLNSSRAKPYSPLVNTRGTKDRRSVGIFTPPAKSPYTPGRGHQSFQQQSFNQTLQTSLYQIDSAQHQLEAYDSLIPILVTEAVTNAPKQNDLSVKLDPCGWAWLIHGRKLLVWRYKGSPTSKLSYCKELILPATDLRHSVDLVTVLPSRDNQTAACVAVSPEGNVRYWPNIAHDAAFVEVSAGLQGQEAAKIVSNAALQCVLATTSSNLHLLLPKPGQNSIEVKPMTLPQGLLSGVGRRMSSFFFGANTSQLMQEKFRGLVTGEVMEDGSRSVYLLAGNVLQKWAIMDKYEKFCYQFNVNDQLKENMAAAVWGQDASQMSGLKVWLLDMHLVRDGLVILGAGVNQEVSPTMHYVLGTLHTSGQVSPQSFLSFTISKYTATYQEEDREGALKLKLLLPNPDNTSVFLHDRKSVIALSVSSSDTPYDRVDFQSPGDQILGAGICDRSALFFSCLHGLVVLKNVQQTNIGLNDSVAALSESFISKGEPSMDHIPTSQLHEMSISDDKTARLKAAFLHHCRGNHREAEDLVEELFPTGVPTTGLDALVVQLSEEMVDCVPRNDPRWAEAANATSASASLFVHHQLEDKLKAHDYYLQFLKSKGLWNRLGAIRIRDSPMTTRLVLCEHQEKVVAAMALRNLHAVHNALVDRCIRRVLELRHEKLTGTGLTAQDVFYRQASKVDDIFECFLHFEEEHIASGSNPAETIKMVTIINTIITSMMQDAWQHRQSCAVKFETPEDAPPDPEYIAWTASVGPRGIRTLLIQQHQTTVDQALTVTQDAGDANVLYQLLLQLTDIILDGYNAQLESLRQAQGGDSPRYQEVLSQYETTRHDLISTFMKDGQHERAASLAEKYCDFDLLVGLCEETDNQDRLQRYINMFHNKGFSDFVFRWYVKKGKHGKLLTSSLSSHPQLSNFLQNDDHTFISWVHDIMSNNFHRAEETLFNNAVRETDFCGKKKTLLSLGKLCALAADDHPADFQGHIEDINTELEMIMNQEQLPEKVVQSLGMDAKNMSVLKPRELIELYVSRENSNANEFDFKKALDILHFVDRANPDDIKELLLHIWCQAILRDSWLDIDANDPMENCRDTLFFKTVELICTTGNNVKDLLPTAEALLSCDELGDLKDNTSFQFLIKAGYERITRYVS